MDYLDESKYLLLEVERQYGKSITGPSDFESLRQKVYESTGDLVSISTFKRLWKYVGDNHKSRLSTLNILSKYVGRKDFADFVSMTDFAKFVDSRYFSGTMLRAEDLSCGAEVLLSWNPDREVLLRYEGDRIWRVIDHSKSKLEDGDRFRATAFIQGEPLYLETIIRDGKPTAPYIAGQRGGIKGIQLIKAGA